MLALAPMGRPLPCTLAPLALALVWAGCTPPASQDALTVLLSDDVLSLDPNRRVEQVSDSVLFNVFEPLVGFDDNLEVRTLLAESWEHPSPEQWRFRLRKGVVFHDGTPLTAGLVRDAFAALQHSGREVEASHFLEAIQSILAVDDLTLDIVTREPRALLSSLPFVYVAKKNAAGSFPPLVGTGPYRIREHRPGERVVLEAAPGWRGPAPEFREVRFVPVRDAAERVGRLRDGRADIAYGVPPELATRQGEGYRFVSRPGLAVFYVGFNLRPAPGNPYTDPRVREAFHLAVDRQAIVDRVLLGRGEVATQPVSPVVFGYDPDLPRPRRDLERARRLMAEAGHPKGFKTRLDFRSSRLRVAKTLGESLRELGVEVELNGLDGDAFDTAVNSGKSELFFLGWDCSTGEASEFFEFLLHTPSERHGMGNYGAWSNAEVDRIAESNSAVLDVKARKRLLQRAAAIVMEALPVLPLYLQDEIYGVRDPVTFRPRADSEVRLADVKRAQH